MVLDGNVRLAVLSDRSLRAQQRRQRTDQHVQRGGSAFMEMQLYPPGFPPSSIRSAATTPLVRALTIDSLECTEASPLQLASRTGQLRVIQNDGSPPDRQPVGSRPGTDTPNQHTLLMNPGDVITSTCSMHRAGEWGNAPSSGDRRPHHHRSGFMQASAQRVREHVDQQLPGTPYNFQPSTTQRPRQHDPWRRCRPTSARSSRPATSRAARA